MYGGSMYGQMPDYAGNRKRFQQGPDSYNVGNRIYNGFSNSPQAGEGGLDNAGFLDRDQQAKLKRAFLMRQLSNGGF